MPYKRIKDSLPTVYDKVLPELFESLVPEETFADCPNCPMACNSRDELYVEDAKPFAPDSKCCTYHPDLPNYMVGGLLQDDDPSLAEGKERIRKKIRERIGVFPQGIFAPRLYKIMYENGRLQGFGRSSGLLCPYFASDTGGCSVWKYREAICATWFCKHVASDKGKILWNSVHDYLRHVQQSYIEDILLVNELPLDDPYGGDVLIEDLDGKPLNDKEYARRWGKWVGREEEFFRNAFTHVSKLTADEFSRLTGVRERSLREYTRKAYHDVITIPEFLTADYESPAVKKLSPELYQITLTVPVHGKAKDMKYTVPVPAAVLDSFDGQTRTEDAWDSLPEKHGVSLDDEILLALFHHNVLVSKDS